MEAVYHKTTGVLANKSDRYDSTDMYLGYNREEMFDPSLSEYLNSLLDKYGIKKADLFRKAGIEDSNYGYEISGDDLKNPSRDVCIRLCLAFPLEIDEAQQVLLSAGEAPLYPGNIRDVHILFALKNEIAPDRLNMILNCKGLRLLE